MVTQVRHARTHIAWIALAAVTAAAFVALLLLLTGIMPPVEAIIDTGPLGSRGNPIDISILNPIRPSID